MSAIREAIRERRRPTPRAAPVGRGGWLDLLLVAVVALAVAGRTPVGGLIGWAIGQARGQDAELPTLTAYFSTGAAAPPPVEAVELLAPPPEAPPPAGLPEPWRTAARTTLARQIPPALAAGLPVATPEAALAQLDAWWAERPDAERALEIAAIGAEQRDRAIGRAAAAGEADPEAYASHRRYLPARAAAEADAFVSGTLALATALDLGWPLDVPHRVTSPFGDRNHPVLGTRKFHNGVDLAVPIGTPVVAAQAGEVAVVGESQASGRYVVLDHGHGVRTAYCHLDATPLPQGSRVRKGETFALSGNTGRSTGPHLHYIVRLSGHPVDPERFRPRGPDRG